MLPEKRCAGGGDGKGARGGFQARSAWPWGGPASAGLHNAPQATSPAGLSVLFALALLASSCGDRDHSTTGPESREEACTITAGEDPDFSTVLGCESDFTALASQPLDASIPGAISAKTVIDRADANTLYFQNSRRYPIHWDFTSALLSGGGRPIVPALSQFNLTEYYDPDRRFVLGALTRYDGPGLWTYEIAPYDNASIEMISAAYGQIAAACFCGDELYFHPTSQAVGQEAGDLPGWVKVVTTDELYAGIDYQALNYGTSMGRLVFITAEELETEFVGFRDIVVIDQVPNDISVVAGIITQAFQTPLAHVNVLSQNRGTPNMALRGAWSSAELLALDGRWVRLQVGPFAYSVSEVTKEEADAWWESNQLDEVTVPSLALEVRDLRDIEDVLDLDGALAMAIPAFGGKASHFAAFPHMDNDRVPFPRAFAVPVFYYWQFMEQNGFLDEVSQMLADPAFQDDPAVRDQRLGDLRGAMRQAPVDPDFEAALLARLDLDYPGVRMRFRSSTNAEDLDGFTGAGLYTSKSGDPNDPDRPVLDAVRRVWASVWNFRAFEERSFRGIDHRAVGMALLVHNSFPDEEANGVGITANPFDESGLEPGFYINVQVGEESVVQPEPGVTSDQFIYQFELPGQPIIFIAHSSLTSDGAPVLTRVQTHALGIALKEIHDFFFPVYGDRGWYAMDTEFKFDQPVGANPGEKPVLFIKQARPYPGLGAGL